MIVNSLHRVNPEPGALPAPPAGVAPAVTAPPAPGERTPAGSALTARRRTARHRLDIPGIAASADLRYGRQPRPFYDDHIPSLGVLPAGDRLGFLSHACRAHGDPTLLEREADDTSAVVVALVSSSARRSSPSSPTASAAGTSDDLGGNEKCPS